MNNILISTECVADIPEFLYKGNDVEMIYFDVQTDKGLFKDKIEINSQNVMEYMVGGLAKAHSVVPSANDFKKYFDKHLEEYDEIIHVCISQRSSEAFKNASLARAKMGANGAKVHLVDSLCLSGGQALITLEAMKLRDMGLSSKEILEKLDEFIPRVSTSFLANNADYLYYNGKVDKKVMQICRFFNLHPVLAMINGKMTVKGIYIGSYKKAAKKYIKKAVGKTNKIDKSLAFVVYSGCDLETTNLVRETVAKKIKFENLYETQASATVSSNCGPSTFGVLYVRKEL